MQPQHGSGQGPACDAATTWLRAGAGLRCSHNMAPGRGRPAMQPQHGSSQAQGDSHRAEELSAGAQASHEEVRRLQLRSVQEGNLWRPKAPRGPSMPLGSARKELKQQNMHIMVPRRRHKKEFFQQLKLQDQVLQLQHQLETQRQKCLQFCKLQMRLHTDQVILEQIQDENQCLNQQVATLTAAFMALQKMEVQDLLAKKEALKDVQENYVFLESEIKSPRDVPGGGNSTEMTSSQLSLELSVTGSITPSSTVDGSTYSSDLSFVGLCHPASVMRTTEMPSLAQSSGLTQALQRKVIAQGIEIPNCNSAPSRNLSLSVTVSGQLQDCFSPLFTDSRKIAQSLGYMEHYGRTRTAYEDYQKFASSVTYFIEKFGFCSTSEYWHIAEETTASMHTNLSSMHFSTSAPVSQELVQYFESAIGNLKIAEVDPGGHFVKILNCDPEKEESIGDYLLKQDVQGQPVAVFQFPPETRMGPSSTVTVWAADATVLHKPPSDFLWKDLERFRTSLDCATILCEPGGQAVAWYTPLYWNRRQGWVAKKQSENIENMVIPTLSTTKQKEGREKEQEFTITDTEWKRADPGQTGKKRQSFIKREKKTSASLFPNQSAWCQSPNSPTHPHFSLVRPLTMGNDGSSLCRQSRCQSSRPDPVPGTLYAGTRQKKNPSVPSCVNGEGRSRPTRSAGPNFGGVMYVGSLPPVGTALQKYFVTPSYSSMLQTHRLL